MATKKTTKKKKATRPRKPTRPKLHHIHPALRAHAVEVSALIEDPKNLRLHEKKNLDAIEGSLRRFGQQKPLILDPTDETIVKAGNGMLRVAHERMGWEYIAAIQFYGESSEVDAFALADNRTGELSDWFDTDLAAYLQSLQGEDEGLLIGWSSADIEALVKKVEAVSDATLLRKLKVTIDDPKTEVVKGEVWRLGDHTLVIAEPVNDVKRWLPFLSEDMLFCPYPGPFVPLSLRGARRLMLLVQPDLFIAGHIIDKFKEANGKRAVKRLEE